MFAICHPTPSLASGDAHRRTLHLTGFLFEALLAKASHVELTYDEGRSLLVARYGDRSTEVASSYASGFTFPHQIHETRNSLVNKVQVLLAGGLAEELVFGEGHASIGRGQDREMATVTVIEIIRRYGFDPEFQATYTLDGPASMDTGATDPDIEKMMARLVADTRQVLRDHQKALVDLAAAVRDAGALNGEEIAVVLRRNGLDVAIRPEGDLLVEAYDTQLR